MIWRLALAAFLGAQSPQTVNPNYDRYLRPSQLVQVEPDRNINLRCEGTGAPTIILEAGLGFPSLSWRDVQSKLAQFSRTCSYDRAGLGFSDAGPMPRSASAITNDLERLIQVAGLQPPFLLVGNSMGGQIVRLFAFRHPENVAGLVLLDPYVEGQYAAFARADPSIGAELRQIGLDEARCVEALRAGRLSAPAAEQRDCIAGPNPGFSPELIALLRRQRMRPASFETAYSESRMLDTQNEVELARERRHLGSVPVVVLSAHRNFASRRFDRTRAALMAEQARLHASLAALSKAGELRATDAGHVIQTSNPDAVVEAVRDVLAKSRSR